MYVARRAFRNYNSMILPGSVVEPGSIKWFKTRFKDRLIVEVNAHNFEQWAAYFKAKFGVTLTKEEQVNSEELPNESDESTNEPEGEPTSEPKNATKVVKVVVAIE